jgi:hypothetical protein
VALRATQAQPHSWIAWWAKARSWRALLKKVASARRDFVPGESAPARTRGEGAALQQRPRLKAFMNITCSALPEALMESELFGQRARRLHGRRSPEGGCLADCGWCFTSRLGLRRNCCASSKRTFKRVGGAVDIKVDAGRGRTNRNLQEEVAGRRAKICFTG